MRIYIDRNDWWIGYYRGPNHHYICPLPTLVIQVKRKHAAAYYGGEFQIVDISTDGITTAVDIETCYPSK